MGLFEELVGIAGGQTAGPTSQNTLATIVRAGLNEGLSGNAMLSALQSVGRGIRRQSFYQLVGEVQSSLSAGSWAIGVDPNTLPGPGDIVPWVGGTPGKYLTRVNVYRRVQVAAGEYQVERRGLSFLSNDPISPGQAVQFAADLPIGQEGTDLGQNLGYEYNGTYYQSA